MIKWLPNIITLGALFVGFIGLTSIMQGYLEWAGFAILIAAVLDFFDGFVARALNAQSAIGAQLDSLCDFVNFGVLPSLVGVSLFQRFASDESWFTHYTTPAIYSIALLMFVYLLGAVLRLARFNVVEDKGFKGIPSPAAAIFMAGFPIMYLNGSDYWPFSYELYQQVYESGLVIFISTIAMGVLMVLPIPMMSFKHLGKKWQNWLLPALLLAFAIISLILFGYFAIQLIVLFYLIVSILQKLLPHEV